MREIVSLQHQTHSREWQLVFVEEHNALLVVREWPDGSVTAYAADSPD